MADKSVFDLAKLMESTCDDRELAGEVTGVFLTDIPQQLDDLDAALAAGDAKTAERVCHSIKGASATVGGEQLRAAALDCETLGREDRLDELGQKVAELRRLFGDVREALLAEGFVAE